MAIDNSNELDQASPPIEVIQAKRPIEAEQWFGDFALRSWELQGTVFDFRDVGQLALTLFGIGEMLNMREHSDRLGSVTVKEAVNRAKKEVPSTYKGSMPLNPVGLDIRLYNELSGPERTLVMKVTSTPELEDERSGITRGIDIRSGFWHKWRTFDPEIKLATIVNYGHVEQTLLDELSSHLPDEITAQPGFIRKASVNPPPQSLTIVARQQSELI